MNPLFSAAAELLTFCAAEGWQCCVIGGLAVQRWGDPRQTRDVDVTLLTGLGGEDRFVDRLLEHYRPRIADARRFALEHRVLLVESGDGVALDISCGGLPFEERLVSRATPFIVDSNTRFLTCSAEDLVVLKAFAARPQDWLDVEAIIVRQGAALDRSLIVRELQPLLALKEDDTPMAMLASLFDKHPLR